jgi:hypothetical protein
LLSGGSLTRSELTGESILGLGESRDLGCGMLEEKSWVTRPPKSSLGAGCEMVSDIDIGGEGAACDKVDAREKMHSARGSRIASGVSYILPGRADHMHRANV